MDDRPEIFDFSSEEGANHTPYMRPTEVNNEESFRNDLVSIEGYSTNKEDNIDDSTPDVLPEVLNNSVVDHQFAAWLTMTGVAGLTWVLNEFTGNNMSPEVFHAIFGLSLVFANIGVSHFFFENKEYTDHENLQLRNTYMAQLGTFLAIGGVNSIIYMNTGESLKFHNLINSVPIYGAMFNFGLNALVNLKQQGGENKDINELEN